MRKLIVLVFALTVLAALPALADAPATQSDTEGPADAVELELLLDAPAAQPVNDCRAQGGGQCICPQYYAPVCGCDGRDYPNPDCASCKVTSWTTGTCDGGVFLSAGAQTPAGE